MADMKREAEDANLLYYSDLTSDSEADRETLPAGSPLGSISPRGFTHDLDLSPYENSTNAAVSSFEEDIAPENERLNDPQNGIVDTSQPGEFTPDLDLSPCENSTNAAVSSSEEDIATENERLNDPQNGIVDTSQPGEFTPDLDLSPCENSTNAAVSSSEVCQGAASVTSGENNSLVLQASLNGDLTLLSAESGSAGSTVNEQPEGQLQVSIAVNPRVEGHAEESTSSASTFGSSILRPIDVDNDDTVACQNFWPHNSWSNSRRTRERLLALTGTTIDLDDVKFEANTDADLSRRPGKRQRLQATLANPTPTSEIGDSGQLVASSLENDIALDIPFPLRPTRAARSSRPSEAPQEANPDDDDVCLLGMFLPPDTLPSAPKNVIPVSDTPSDKCAASASLPTIQCGICAGTFRSASQDERPDSSPSATTSSPGTGDGAKSSFAKGPPSQSASKHPEDECIPTSTKCGHLFCEQCIRMLVRTDPHCPMCRSSLRGIHSWHRIYL
eukprot:GHVT01085228.1.p1 GENE.GHVT01085228.1~~GHVT01085228.1.p1  ORF type:complete len:502 (+),score=30.16 GHVT01085228.1:188-1693(+)